MTTHRVRGADNLIAALWLNCREFVVRLGSAPVVFQTYYQKNVRASTAMAQDPSPDPEDLAHWFVDDIPPIIISDSFSGGSAPSLLTTFPFPALPKLRLSATNLSHVQLEGIPDSSDSSPRVLVTSPSAPTRLPLDSNHPTSPEPTSASADTHCPPFSHLSSPWRCCRVPGGLFDLNQCGENKVRVVALRLIHLRHFTAPQVHPISRQLRCTRSSNCDLCMQQRLYKNFNGH